MIIINDVEIIEGLIGGLGWLLLMYQIKQILLRNASVFFTSIFTWTYFWYVRKIGMNLYKNFKKRHNISDDQIALNISSDIPIIMFILFLAIISFHFLKEYNLNINDFYLSIGILSILMILIIT